VATLRAPQLIDRLALSNHRNSSRAGTEAIAR
jgi:hypothetical protein